MLEGEQNRSTAATDLNLHSSRSHMIFQAIVSTRNKISRVRSSLYPFARYHSVLDIHLTRLDTRQLLGTTTDSCSNCQCLETTHLTWPQVTTTAKLSLVDLAGSERHYGAMERGQTLIEAAAINKSLSALNSVFAAIRHHDAHVPYRNSKLTHVLQVRSTIYSITLLSVSFSWHPLCDTRRHSINIRSNNDSLSLSLSLTHTHTHTHTRSHTSHSPGSLNHTQC